MWVQAEEGYVTRYVLSQSNCSNIPMHTRFPLPSYVAFALETCTWIYVCGDGDLCVHISSKGMHGHDQDNR